MYSYYYLRDSIVVLIRSLKYQRPNARDTIDRLPLFFRIFEKGRTCMYVSAIRIQHYPPDLNYASEILSGCFTAFLSLFTASGMAHSLGFLRGDLAAPFGFSIV